MKITKYMKETLNDVKAMLSTGKNLNNGIWLVGRAGSGKSTIGEYVANELNLPFKSISINASTDPIEF
jgi:adenylylsulfate kinase-like enzyme